jgi:hypothetical protein
LDEGEALIRRLHCDDGVSFRCNPLLSKRDYIDTFIRDGFPEVLSVCDRVWDSKKLANTSDEVLLSDILSNHSDKGSSLRVADRVPGSLQFLESLKIFIQDSVSVPLTVRKQTSSNPTNDKILGNSSLGLKIVCGAQIPQKSREAFLEEQIIPPSWSDKVA